MYGKVVAKKNKKGGWNIKVKADNPDDLLKFIISVLFNFGKELNEENKKALTTVVRNVCDMIDEKSVNEEGENKC